MVIFAGWRMLFCLSQRVRPNAFTLWLSVEMWTYTYDYVASNSYPWLSLLRWTKSHRGNLAWSLFLVIKLLLLHNHFNSFVYCLWLLSNGTIIVTETMWPGNPKILTIWLFTESLPTLTYTKHHQKVRLHNQWSILEIFTFKS